MMFSSSDVSSHNSETDCWIVIDGIVYDVTSFLSRHPGGAKTIVRRSGDGQDAKSAFDAVDKSKGSFRPRRGQEESHALGLQRALQKVTSTPRLDATD